MLVLPRTGALVPRLEVLAEAGSTNAELVGRALADPAGWPDGALLVTDTQTSGRGRLGRAWTAPAGTSLAISLLVRPDLPPDRLGWIPLLAGAAMTMALRRAGVPAELKWPNDVLIRGRKVCGILAEVLPDGRGAVVGAGLNHAIPAARLPVPTATSLLAEGLSADVDGTIADYVATTLGLLADLARAGGDADASGVRGTVAGLCGTIGRPVRVAVPDGTTVVGTAIGIDADGRILVRPDAGASPSGAASLSEPVALATGDVEHLRYE